MFGAGFVLSSAQADHDGDHNEAVTVPVDGCGELRADGDPANQQGFVIADGNGDQCPEGYVGVSSQSDGDSPVVAACGEFDPDGEHSEFDLVSVIDGSGNTDCVQP